jgi:hypothetical protein
MEPLVGLTGVLREKRLERGEPRSDAGEAQEGTQRRPWWRGVFGG